MQLALSDYVWAAGIATELVNTTADVWGGEDHLPNEAGLIGFTELHVAHAKNQTNADDRLSELTKLARQARRLDLLAVHTLRTTVRELIDHPDREHLVEGASRLSSSVGGATLVPDPAHQHRTRWAVSLRPQSTIADALSLICGIGILGVVNTLGEERFRPCSAPDCRGAFIDTTRPGRRRYCMPGLCGNRTNVANYRARQAAPRGPGSSMT
jgi:predicted RNA-binding Zn ribbon-like protein